MALPQFLKDGLLALYTLDPAILDDEGRRELFGTEDAEGLGPYAGGAFEMCEPLGPTAVRRHWWTDKGWEPAEVLKGPRPRYTVRAFFGERCALMFFTAGGVRLWPA